MSKLFSLEVSEKGRSELNNDYQLHVIQVVSDSFFGLCLLGPVGPKRCDTYIRFISPVCASVSILVLLICNNFSFLCRQINGLVILNVFKCPKVVLKFGFYLRLRTSFERTKETCCLKFAKGLAV